MSRVGGQKEKRPRARLVLLGEASLVAGGRTVALDRKEAALLAYVALEGATPRPHLAALLWPTSPPRAAQANVRQLLRRLKVACGQEVVAGRQALALVGGVETDALLLRAHLEGGPSQEAAALDGELLAPFPYTDVPHFEGWLRQARARLALAWRRAAAQELDRLEAEGQLAQALALAQRQLVREPTSEEAFRRLMRLHALGGDRVTALSLYARCQRLLRAQLGAEPLPETQALARALEQGLLPVRPAPPPPSAVRCRSHPGAARRWRGSRAAPAAGL